ncbi:phosphatase RsbU N-terminal domain-containing protein [Pedococcus sp. NPDC057267]|uniref:phosphatase RsbU N-terminal domain-containing protein n=1 Tax=Pedococcus sp. NPDC057267 TaxID=3346077 RepID=UPI00363EAB4C
MSAVHAEALARDYRAAFLRYLPRRSEAALAAGYDLGHRAVEDGVSVLDLAHVHHAVLTEVLEQSPGGDVRGIATAASEFLLEVLATVDLVQRASSAAPARQQAGASDADPADA